MPDQPDPLPDGQFGVGSGREQVLARPPALLPQYLRALRPRTTHAGQPPERVLRMAGVRPGAEHLRRYRALVGEPTAEHLPLLYPHLMAFGAQLQLLTDPHSPFPPLGLLHVANQVTATGPIPQDCALDIAVYPGALRRHRRGRLLDLITEVSRDGAVIWTGTSSYLHRESGAAGGPAPVGGPAPARAPGPAPAGSPTGRAPVTEPAREPAAEPGAVRWRLPGDLGRRYGALSGDRNPIHFSVLTAWLFGFRRPIVHGMWTAAAVLAALHGRVPDAVNCSMQFQRPILLPATVWLHTAAGPAGITAEVRGEDDPAPLLIAEVQPL